MVGAGDLDLGLACDINAMSSKDVLGEIDTDGDNGRHGLPLPKTSELMRDRISHRGTLMPYFAAVRITQDGEVPFIR